MYLIGLDSVQLIEALRLFDLQSDVLRKLL